MHHDSLLCQNPIMQDFPGNKICLCHFIMAFLLIVHPSAVLALKHLSPSEDVYVKDAIATVPSLLEIRQAQEVAE